MFSHIMIGSNDVARSKKFYDALFGAMGAQPGTEDARGRLAYSHNGGRFMGSKPIDGKPANSANGGTIGFAMSSAEQAAAWHKARVANGRASIEHPPGIRQGAAAPFEQRAFEPQLAVQDVQPQSQIELPLAGEDVGDALSAQARQMRVGDPLRQHRDDRVAADVRASPSDLAVRVERDAVGGGV